MDFESARLTPTPISYEKAMRNGVINCLPRPERDTLIARFEHPRMSQENVAKLMGISRRQIINNQTRALERLEDLLVFPYPEGEDFLVGVPLAEGNEVPLAAGA